MYKSHIQLRLDYDITLYGSSTQENIDLVQRVQNHAARLIMGNFDYINSRRIDLVKSLNSYTIRERRDYFLLILMLKAIHGIAPNYLSDRIDMHFDIHGYEAGSMNVYLPTVNKEMYNNISFILGWQTLEWPARFCEELYEYRNCWMKLQNLQKFNIACIPPYIQYYRVNSTYCMIIYGIFLCHH